ncbi:MAG TPA: ATP-binding cassette domain-containing protein [Solirubrobacteraceae bacterium]|jgi:ABC-type taurine transport system ATPase subunit
MLELLSLTDLHKGYPRGDGWVPVLKDVSLEVLRGEVVAIVGGRLEGKTTLLKIAAGIEPPDRGSVSLAGRSFDELADSREVRWIDRDGPGLEVKVSEFVGWPLAPGGRGRRQAERAAGQMLDRVGAQDCGARRWGELSNWQRVLVGLARGFIGSPRLVVVDDLLDVLGEPATEKASDLLRSLVEASEPRCGVLMSASDMESAMFADRVVAITGKGSLKLMSGRLTDSGEVVPFRECAQGDSA